MKYNNRNRFLVLLAMFLGLSAMFSAHADVNTLGAFEGGINEQKEGNLHQAFEAWLGRSENYVLDFHPSDAPTPANGGPWHNYEEPGWQLNADAGWGGTPYKDRLVISVPMFPNFDGLSLEEGATGAYNAYWASYARKLVEYGYPNIIIRLGWEFNGGWFRWSALGKEAAFVQYWQQIVNAMRSVPGANFKFFWCPNISESTNLDAAYPGNSYVDYIGFDYYDISWVPNTYPIPSDATESEKLSRWTTAWQYKKTEQWGLDYFAHKAAVTGKPLAVGEWGAVFRDDGHGGGDNPNFIQWMHDWMRDNNVVFHLYFDYRSPGDADGRLRSPGLAQVGAKFRELWGATSTVPSGSTHSGSRSLQSTFTSSASYKNLYQYVGGITANTTYAAKCWIKGQGKIQMKVMNAAWTPLAAQVFTATSAWTLVSFNANSGNNSTLVFALTDGGGVAGTLYVDDCSLAAGTGANLLANPGFEADGSWTGTDATTFAIASGAPPSNAAHSGTSVVKAAVSTAPSYNNLYQAAGGLSAGSTYNVSVWLKGSGKIRLKVMDGGWTQTLKSQQFSVSADEWTQYSFTFVATGTWAYLIFTDDGGAAGTLYIDDAFLGAGSNLLSNPDFENGTTSWSGLSGGVFTRIQP